MPLAGAGCIRTDTACSVGTTEHMGKGVPAPESSTSNWLAKNSCDPSSLVSVNTIRRRPPKPGYGVGIWYPMLITPAGNSRRGCWSVI